MDILSMPVRVLKQEIRRLTSEVNKKIAEVRSHGRSDKLFEKAVDALKKETTYVSRQGEVRVPKSRTGELGLGFEGKKKDQLQQQLYELESFYTTEWYSNASRKKHQARAERAYETFTARYGDMPWIEWTQFIGIIGDLKSSLTQYGYENYGNSIARLYGEATPEGKNNFSKYIMDTMDALKEEGETVTGERFIDRLTELLEDEEVIPTW